MAKFTIYTTATCSFCHALKSYLTQHGVEYEEKRADTDPSLGMELYQLSGQLGVPFTVVEDKNGKKMGVLGFNKPKFDEILGLS